MNLEMALTKVGGFGRFQLFMTIVFTFVRNMGGTLFYLFAFLILP